MSRRMSFQIQRIQSGNAIEQIELLLHAINACSADQCVEIKVDLHVADDYCNVSLTSSNPKKLWRAIMSCVRENPHEFEWLLMRWIVVLQGKFGWDDYLLLDHFDSPVQTDK